MKKKQSRFAFGFKEYLSAAIGMLAGFLMFSCMVFVCVSVYRRFHESPTLWLPVSFIMLVVFYMAARGMIEIIEEIISITNRLLGIQNKKLNCAS